MGPIRLPHTHCAHAPNNAIGARADLLDWCVKAVAHKLGARHEKVVSLLLDLFLLSGDILFDGGGRHGGKMGGRGSVRGRNAREFIEFERK